MTLFFSHILGSEDCNNTLIMIQPTLMSFKPEQDPEPTLLDSVSIAPDVVLLLDTFFHVLIWHGETVAAWRKAGYHEQEGYEHIKAQMEKPVGDAAVSHFYKPKIERPPSDGFLPHPQSQELIADRFPIPRYIVCDAGGSQARFLLSKLNPSTTHMSGGYGQGQGQAIFTDDVSLQIFMEHLKKCVNCD